MRLKHQQEIEEAKKVKDQQKEMLQKATARREGIESMLESIPSRFKETINEAKGVKDETEEFVP